MTFDLTKRLKIETAIEGRRIVQEKRDYLGYSALGDICKRRVFYDWRWAIDRIITPQKQRLFDRGHQEERVVVADLERAGVRCEYVLENQCEVVGPFGHTKGHPDGILYNVHDAPKTPHLLEVKTANNKAFREFKKFGVEKANPKYAMQAHAYMQKLDLTRCLFVVTQKETDERHYERIKLDKSVALEADSTAVELLTATAPPKRLSEDREWWICRNCHNNELCHDNLPPLQNCRTCANSVLKTENRWMCKLAMGNGPIPVNFQHTGCKQYVRLF